MIVKWIKVSVNLFDDEKIRLIEAMPEADAILNIWLRLILLAGKTNDSGLIYMMDNVPYTDEMLSTLFDKKLNIIRLAVDVFEKFGMIEIQEDGSILLSNFCKYQNIERLEEIKEQNRLRQAKFRGKAKQKKQLSSGSEKDVTLSVTLPNGTDKSKIKNKNSIYSRVIDHLNSKIKTKYRTSTKKTQSLIQARLNEGYKEEDFIKVIENKVEDWYDDNKMSKFLRPSTLFGDNFESYLNSPKKSNENESDYIKPYQKGSE